MIMPSYTTLPESMLGPNAIAQKFAAPNFAGLRGLGCDCENTDSEGNCTDPELCPGDPGYGGPVSTAPSLPSCAGMTVPCGFTGPLNCDSSLGGPNYLPCASTPTTTGSSGGSLSSQQQYGIDQSILASGTQIAKIIAAGATGTSILPNGAIIQPGAANVAGVGVAAASSSTVILVVAVLFGLMFLGGRGK